MPITYPLSLPAVLAFSGVRIMPEAAVASTQSPFTFDTQVYSWPGQRWAAELAVRTMTRADAEEVIAFLLKLNGAEGTFLLGDPGAETPRGDAASSPGSPAVAGAGQTGQDINFDGAPVSVTGYLKAGDWVQLGSGATARLHKVLDDADTDGAGAFTLSLWPKVQAANTPGDNDPLTVSAAKGVFRLKGGLPDWNKKPGILYDGISIMAASEV